MYMLEKNLKKRKIFEFFYQKKYGSVETYIETDFIYEQD